MPTALAPGVLLAGRYQLVAALGGTEFGAVYNALDRVMGRECALKLLHPALRHATAAFSAFQEIERTVAALPADAIARASDFGLDSALGQHFVAGELIGFPSIDELVRSHGRIHLPVFAEAFEVLTTALDAAFAKGIVHGDLKPQNLFFALEHPSWARISDFGMAAVRAACRPDQSAAPLGWATPARLQGAAASREDDIFALGLISFYALTGRHYCRSMWEQVPDPALVARELDAANPSAASHARSLGAELPDFMDSWFARILARDPARRFTSGREASEALSELTQRDGAALAPGIAAAVAAPLLFQSLPPRDVVEKPSLSPMFAPSEPRESAELPRSSRPPTVAAPRPAAREHVDGVPNAPPIAMLAAAAAIVLVLAALGVFAAYRLFMRSSSATPAPSAAASTASSITAPEAPPSPSAEAASTDASAHFGCTPEACEWIVCDGEKLKTGVTLLKLPPGRHSCSASRYGFRTAVVEFTLEAGKTTNVVFELLPSKPKTAPRSAPKPKQTKSGTKAKPASSAKAHR
jgi:serine/threonine-protein kinase